MYPSMHLGSGGLYPNMHLGRGCGQGRCGFGGCVDRRGVWTGGVCGRGCGQGLGTGVGLGGGAKVR